MVLKVKYVETAVLLKNNKNGRPSGKMLIKGGHKKMESMVHAAAQDRLKPEVDVDFQYLNHCRRPCQCRMRPLLTSKVR